MDVQSDETEEARHSVQGRVEDSADRSARVRRFSADDNLRNGLAELSRLSTRLPLEDLLASIAASAVRTVPRSDGSGVRLIEDDRPDLIVATTAFVSEIDHIQHSLKQGPSITAVRERRTVTSGSVGGDPRWPRFGGTVARLGVHSVLSLPLLIPDRVVGVLNLYARDKDAFNDRAIALGELFAVSAAVPMHNAQILAHSHRAAAHLQTALETRVVINRAVGIMMARTGDTAAGALARLRTISQNEHLQLADAARKIVNNAARPARRSPPMK